MGVPHHLARLGSQYSHLLPPEATGDWASRLPPPGEHSFDIFGGRHLSHAERSGHYHCQPPLLTQNLPKLTVIQLELYLASYNKHVRIPRLICLITYLSEV